MAQCHVRFDEVDCAATNGIDGALPRHVMETAIDVFGDVYDVPASPDSWVGVGVTESDDRPRGLGLPGFMQGEPGEGRTAEAKFVTDARAALSHTGGETPDGAATGDGSSHFTTPFVRDGMTVRQAFRFLLHSGQFGTLVAEARADDGITADPVHVALWAVVTYAKGWVAEAVLAATERFSKGSQSNDEHGDDVYDRDDGAYKQVKCVTVDKQAPGHIYYQWTCRGGLVYGSDYVAVNKEAGQVSGRVGDGRKKGVEMGATCIRKCVSGDVRYTVW